MTTTTFKLTQAHINKEVVRTAPHFYPSGVQDNSFIGKPMKLIKIEENGNLLFERHNKSLYDQMKHFGEPVSNKVGFVYTTLNWNDGNWRFATEGDMEEAMAEANRVNSLAISVQQDPVFKALELFRKNIKSLV